MDESDPWLEYARLQGQADSRILSDRSWATDEALEAILDGIGRGQMVSAQQVDDLITNRATKHLRRRRSLARHLHLSAVAANANDCLEARSDLRWHQRRCTDREWRVLISLGCGHTYGRIAAVEEAPQSTVKTWVHRARIKLAA